MSETLAKPPVYCAAPWTHVHLRADGFFSACTRARPNASRIAAGSTEEYWNGEEMKRLRVAMMKHEPPPEVCTACIHNIGTVRAERWSHNERAFTDMAEILASTAPDGTTTFRPNSMDIRTNLCNLKCRMCSASSSSAIHSENLKHGRPVPILGPLAHNEHLLNFSDEALAQIKYISWAGGEPFMSPVHWDVMTALNRLGRHDISVGYNSNFTFPGNTLQRAEKLLAGFSRIRIRASIDGVGEDFDYLRDGANYAEATSNLLALKLALPNATISIDCTVTSLGLLTLEALARFSIEHRIIITCKTVVVGRGDWLSISCVKRDFLESRLAAALEACNDTPLHASMSAFIKHARNSYRPDVPDYERCRERERIRGMAGYMESRIGSFLHHQGVEES